MSEELIERLRERYTAEPIPPCSVCGAALSIQSAGGGQATVYGCNSIPFDLKHYERSRWTQYRPGDSCVLELIEELSASQARLSEAVKVLEGILNEQTSPLHVGYDNAAGGGNYIYVDAVRVDSDAFARAKAFLATLGEENHDG